MVFIFGFCTFSVNLMYSGRLFIHYVFYILSVLQLLYHLVIIHFDERFSISVSCCIILIFSVPYVSHFTAVIAGVGCFYKQ